MSATTFALAAPYSLARLQTLHQAVEENLLAYLQREVEVRSARMLDGALYRRALLFTMRPSKRLRSLLFLLTLEAFVPDANLLDEPPLAVTSALELLHAAILVHDDIIDHDDERGRSQSVHASLREEGYGASATEAALLLADCLLALGPRPILDCKMNAALRALVVSHLCEYTARTSEGQADELYLANNYGPPDATEPLIRAVYVAKMNPTAAECPLVLGALMGSADDSALEALRRCSAPVAFAFQILNDLAGFRKCGAIAAEHRHPDPRSLNLLFHIARQQSTPAIRVELDRYMANADGAASGARVFQMVEASGAVERLSQTVGTLFTEGYEALEAVAESDLRARLRSVLAFAQTLYAPGSAYYEGLGRSQLPGVGT
jgi:geranylgeranyl pyrophosphate synthase